MRPHPAFTFLLFLAACSQQTDPPSEPSSPEPVVAVAQVPLDEQPVFDASCEFCANPTTVRTCDVATGVRTVLYWNLPTANVPHVGIYVVDDAGNDSAFAEQPPSGSIETGPWLKPGLTFKLKDPDGNLLHTVTIDGEDC